MDVPDIRYWTDVAARQDLIERGRVVVGRIRDQLGPGGVVAVEPGSGDHFWSPTLG